MGGLSMKPTEIKNVITEILESRKEEGGIKALYFVGCGGSNGALIQRKHLWKENVQILSQH